MRDFEDWNNAPRHVVPESISEIYRRDERRRERRKMIFFVAVTIAGAAVAVWMSLRF